MATLVYCDGDGASARLELAADVTVGSAAGCTIVSRSGQLAARHARIYQAGGAWWIEDLGGRGDVFVECEKVSQRRLAAGEVAVVGDVILRIDSANGGGRPLIAAAELLRLLELSQRRLRELAEERNALGRRVGELHAELAEERSQAAVVVGAPRDLIAFEATAPMAEKVRQATAAIAELTGQLDEAEARRAPINERIVETQAALASGDPAEREIREVELLSLEAQLAELDKSCESKRAKLEARRRELAALRARLQDDPRQGGDLRRQTLEYAARADTELDDGAKLAELKERFETEFTRAVTLQRKLKIAETRAAELEAELAERDAELRDLERDREAALEARQAIELRLRDAQAARKASPKAADEVNALNARLAELEATLASRDGELASARERLAEQSEDPGAGERIAELEASLARAEKARDSAQARRREADVRILDAETSAREMRAKLELAERRVAEQRAEIERLGRETENARGQLVEARETISLLESSLESSSGSDDSQVIGLERKLEDVRRESDAEIELLGQRIKELERDLDRALDAEQVALARSDAEQAARQEELERLTADLGQVRDELATTGERLASIRHELSESQERGDAVAAERDELAARVRSLEQLEADLAAAAGELAEARADLVTAHGRIAELETERRSLLVDRDRARALERELDSARSALSETRAELGGLAEQLATARGGASATKDLRSRVVELASQNAQISAELVALGEQKARTDSDLAAARAELERLTAELSQVRGELTDTARLAEASGGAALERECHQLRERIADLELQLSEGIVATTESADRPDTLSDDVDLTAVADASPALIEHTAALREAINDLRRQMRTAADEAVMLEGSEATEIINVALSSAVERVETAREAIRHIVEILGLE